MVSRHKTIQRFCEVCGNEFWPRKQRVDAGLGRFCSLKCCGISQRSRGKENYRVHIDKVSGRRKAFWRDDDGMQHSTLYARHLWEMKFGEIPDGYEVHHKDGNILNDSLDNLVLLSRDDHRLIEHGAERQIINNKSIRKCPRCGKFNIDEDSYKRRVSYCKP